MVEHSSKLLANEKEATITQILVSNCHDRDQPPHLLNNVIIK